MKNINYLSRKENWVLLVGILLLTSVTTAWSQVKEMRSFPSEHIISGYNNSNYYTVYKVAGKNPALYTYRDNLVTEASNIENVALNPNGSSVAYINHRDIVISSFTVRNTELFKIKGSQSQAPKVLAYTADARHFIVAYSNGRIIYYDTRKYLPTDTLETKPIQALTISPNNYFIVTLLENQADVWNFETKAHRTQLAFDSKVNNASFSTDGSMLAITTENKVLIYNTRTWELIQKINTDALVAFPSFNSDNKYLAYVQNSDTTGIVIYNVRKQDIEQRINESGLVGGLNFINTSQRTMLLSSRLRSLVFWDTSALAPYYGKLLDEEVNQKMNDWVKMMDGESMADYQIRVNDSTRVKQMELFQQEVATRMAGDRLSLENPFAGDYQSSEGCRC